MSTKSKSKSNYARFYAVLSRMHGAEKADVIWQYSKTVTTSLSEFARINPQGYQAMVLDLEKKFPHPSATTKGDFEKTTKKLRSGILTRLQKHGIDTTNWECVNRFMENPRIAGQRLYSMSHDDMREFIKKMESILAKDAHDREIVQKQSKLN